jgi:hypothetical protein
MPCKSNSRFDHVLHTDTTKRACKATWNCSEHVLNKTQRTEFKEYLDKEFPSHSRSRGTGWNIFSLNFPYQKKTHTWIYHLLVKQSKYFGLNREQFQGRATDSIFVTRTKTVLDPTQLLIQCVQWRFLWSVK